MKEEWILRGAIVPIDPETTAALVAEIKRLIDVVGGMALARHEWVGLTDEDIWQLVNDCTFADDLHADKFARAIEAKLQEKNT